MKVNGIAISEKVLKAALKDMIKNGNEGQGIGKFYLYNVSQNYMTEDGYIDEEDFKLRVAKSFYPYEIVMEAEFSKESKIYQEALAAVKEV